jgi:FtsP/CotA-like multicopper oxidase with cupredoxin domain
MARGASRIDRRQALRLGGVGIAAGALHLTGWRLLRTGAAGAGDATTTTADPTPPVGDELVAPPEVTSSGGVLRADLTAVAGDAQIAGQTVSGTTTYDGGYPAATWRIAPGETFEVDLTNQLDSYTNLHWHGMHVTPEVDDVLLEIEPGATQHFTLPVPADHQAGLYWYHPHYHTQVDDQVYRGMAGLIVVEGGWRDLPGIAEATEKILVIKDIAIDDGTVQRQDLPQTSDELLTVNAQINPRISARPGERQLWRIGNLGNDSWLRLALDGHDLQIVAIDGVGVVHPEQVSEYVLPPAGRIEVLVDVGDEGSWALKTLPVFNGFTGFDERTLATLVVEGEAVTGLPPVPDEVNPDLVDLSAGAPDRHREIRFGRASIVTDDGSLIKNDAWLICDLPFNDARVDVTARLGDLEEWTIRNDDLEDHPFHIHQNDFQVVEVDGAGQPFNSHRDTVTIPRGGTVKIRQRYTDFTGRWVFHCHILNHEDHGMMAIIEVTE